MPVLCFLQEQRADPKPVENVSDSEGYPSLEGHTRAASLPRLNAEYHVSSSPVESISVCSCALHVSVCFLEMLPLWTS